MIRNIKKCIVFEGLNIKIGNASLDKLKFRNLGRGFDQTMSMQPNVNSISSSCQYQFGNIARMRKHVDIDDCKNIVFRFISRLSYASVLIYGLPAKQPICLATCVKLCGSIGNAFST